MEQVKICGVEWFNGLSGTIGIIVVENNGKLASFVGAVPDGALNNDTNDAQYILHYGCPFPLKAAQHFFPWIELPKGF